MQHKKACEVVGLVVALMLAVGAGHVSLIGQAKTDVTGTWAFDVNTSGGAGTPTIAFKQDGEALTGTYEGQLGKAPLKGTVKGQAITFSFVVDVQGQNADVVYDGTVSGSSMKGTVNIGGGTVTGTFTATRK